MNKNKVAIFLGSIAIVLATFLWSTDLFFRYDLLKVLDPVSLVWLEHLVILIVICPLSISCIASFFRLKQRHVLAVLFIGVIGSALGTVAFSYAFFHINPAVPIVLQKLQPFVAIAGAEFILKARHPRFFYIFALLGIIGAVLLSHPYLVQFVQYLRSFFSSVQPAQLSQISRDASSGLVAGFAVICALISVVGWGLNTVFGRMVSMPQKISTKKRISAPLKPLEVTYLRIFFGFCALFLWMFVLGIDTRLLSFSGVVIETPVMGLKVLYMALVIGLVALLLYYQGIKHVKAKLATLLELFYPAFSLILAYVFLHQKMTWIQILGITMIVLASSICTWRGVQTK